MKLNLKTILSTILIMTLAMGSLSIMTSAAETSAVNIIDQSGEMETIYATWWPVTGASDYNVYLKDSAGGRNKINSNLVRKYDDGSGNNYYRADAVGIRPGNYSLEIIPVISGTENTSKKAETSSHTVISYDRAGFSFLSEYAKDYVGGYNKDGSLPSDAQVIYITDKTKDTVTLDVITNSKGALTTCTGLGAIFSAREKAYDLRPLVIRFLGKVTSPSGVNSSGFLQVKKCQNVTIEGIGNDGVIHGWGLLIREAKNVEIRNLAVMWFKDDAISLDTKNYGIWIHDNDLFYGQKGSDKDQAKGDGSVDIKAGSKDITVSYNHFWDSGKASLNGMKSESTDYKITYHHNWFDHSDSRHPRTRTMTTHVYNNYYDGVSKYGVGVTMNSSTFVEGNYFRNCKYPMLISLQGSDTWNGSGYTTANGTFSGEAGGMIKAYGNHIEGATRFVDQNHSQFAIDGHFDAITVANKKDTVPSTYKSLNGGYTYNNFDTASSMYSYTVETAEQAKATVEKYAGRVQGGDFKWVFTSADDTSYDVDAALSNAVANYSSKLILDATTKDDDEEIGGDILPSAAPTQVPSNPPETPQPTGTPTQTPTPAPTPKPNLPKPSDIDNGGVSSVPAYAKGDVNGDNFITAADAAIARQYILNKKKLLLTPEELAAADVDGSGTIDHDDAVEIMNYVLTGKSNYIGVQQ